MTTRLLSQRHEANGQPGVNMVASVTADEALVGAAKSGDHQAFVELWKRHSNAAFETACRIMGNRHDAEDVLQDAWMKAYPHLNAFDGRAKFATWLTRIAMNSALMTIRKGSFAGRTPNVLNVGISYMYMGKWLPNMSRAMGKGKEFHVGPHIMVVGLDQKKMQTLNQDGSNGEPYANHLPGRTELYLVIPIREWEGAHGGQSHRRRNTMILGECPVAAL